MRTSHCSKTYQLAAARGGKFPVFSAFFDEKHGNRRHSRHYFAISGRPLSRGGVRPDAPQILRDPGQRSRAAAEADDVGLPPLQGPHTAPREPLSSCHAGLRMLGTWRVHQALRAGRIVRRLREVGRWECPPP